MTQLIRAVFVTNIPAPYRERVHELVAARPDIAYTVIYCAALEPNRQWKFPFGKYSRIFLEERKIPVRGQYVYLGTSIFRHLNQLRPNVVITGGFSIPMLLAFAWAKLHGARHIAFSDSNPFHENHLTTLHRLLRKIVYPLSAAFLGPSEKTRSLYALYKKNGLAFYQTHLCADNTNYAGYAQPLEDRRYDVMFCGRICKEKKFDFFAEVLQKLDIGRPLRVLVVGDGPDREILLDKLSHAGMDVTFTGFLDQHQLPAYYAQARLLLFPTERDAWGIVANEAMAVGTPVITCPEAGVADELVINEVNGYVRPLDLNLWAECCQKLLTDSHIWQRFTQAAILAVKPFSYENAATGISEAILYIPV